MRIDLAALSRSLREEAGGAGEVAAPPGARGGGTRHGRALEVARAGYQGARQGARREQGGAARHSPTWMAPPAYYRAAIALREAVRAQQKAILDVRDWAAHAAVGAGWLPVPGEDGGIASRVMGAAMWYHRR